MPIRTAIWKVGNNPHELTETSLAREQTLEEMIISAPRLLSNDYMLILKAGGHRLWRPY